MSNSKGFGSRAQETLDFRLFHQTKPKVEMENTQFLTILVLTRTHYCESDFTAIG